MNDLLLAKNLPSVTRMSLADAEGSLEALLKAATERAGELLVGNEMDDAEELAQAIRGGRLAMRILQELTDEIGRAA